MLDRLGHHVDTGGNGFDAVAAVTSHPYDVVLMDVQMPDVDGLEATRRIRSRLARDQVPYLVAMTANALPEDREECIRAGMHDYLSKPVRIHELKDVLAKIAVELPVTEDVPVTAAVADEVLRELTEQLGDASGEMQAELVDQYLAEASSHLALLRDVVASSDYAVIRSVSQTWRSTSALLEASRLAVLLQALEVAAAHLSSSCAVRSTAVGQEYVLVRQALRERTERIRTLATPAAAGPAQD